jgi:hypothetical protein
MRCSPPGPTPTVGAPFDALPELASVAEMTRLRFESLETPPQLLRD